MKVVERLRQALIYRLAPRLPDCKTITQLMSRSLDERISLRDRLKVNVHRLMCRACRHYLAQISFIRRAMQIQDDLMLEDAGNPSARSDSDLKPGIRDGMCEHSDSQM